MGLPDILHLLLSVMFLTGLWGRMCRGNDVEKRNLTLPDMSVNEISEVGMEIQLCTSMAEGHRPGQLLSLCSPFNLDVHRPRLFSGPPEAEFGYSVLQHVGGGRRWMLVGAPWDGPSGDRRGDVYRCPIGGSHSAPCAKGHLGDYPLGNSSHPAMNMHLGMSLLETDNDGGFMACAPLWSRACGSSVFSSGICAHVDASFRPQGSLAPTAQRCPTYMDVVIVLDGSNSIYPWSEVQTFLRRLVGRLFIDPEQIQVGLVQYGESPVHEWSLGDFRTKEEVVRAARNLSRREGRETKTAQAILVACTEGFSPSRGGRPEAARLLVVVTDGESHDGEELPAALKACEAGRVTRYGIAVLGHYLRRQRDPSSFLREIRTIASDPDERFFFNVTDEAVLTDIVDALGDRIFGLEGSRGENESSFGLEMSQIGFSTHRLKDGILFGMVGAYDWGGSVLWLEEGHRLFPPRTALEDEFPPALQNHAAYLGYSVSSMLLRGGRRLFLSGAPRFRHRGKVIAFQLKRDGAVRVAQSLQGEQIGSYFGSELCPLDTDGDGTTNVLLVAAPMFLGPQNKETGRVYVYLVDQQSLLTLQGTLQPEPPQDARFGFAMGALPDLNQDGFADVAVGAPLEDGHHGALYLYHGAQSGIRPRPAQRIAAISMPQALSYFGRSVDGRLDLDGDDLVDVAVGAQGAAVLLSSRPIVHLAPSLEVTPPAISVVQRDCSRRGQEAACLSAALCFRVTSRTPGHWDRRFYLRFTASLDEWTTGARAVFDGSGQRLSPRRLRLSVGNVTCEQLRFHVLDTSDYLRPVALTVTFALDNTTKPGPVLDEGSPTSIRKLVPFSKDCGPDNECVTDLVLRADMDIRGSRKDPFVVRGSRQKVLVSATLENRKENAYNTSLNLSFSRNLHLASFTPQRDSPVKVECTAPSPHARLCSVGHPVFQAGAKVTFLLEFEFSCSFLLSQVLVRLTATSNSLERNGTLQDNTAQTSAYIHYEPRLLFSSESTLHRYEVHPYGPLPVGPEFKTTLRVQNLGCYVVSGLIISALLPAVAHGGNYFLSLSQFITNNRKLHSTEPDRAPRTPCAPRGVSSHKQTANGSNTRCQVVRCHLGRLAKGTEVSVGLLRLVHNEFFRRAKFKSLMVVSTFELGAKEGSVLQLPEASRWSESLLEVIQTRPVLISLWLLIGSVLGGLLLLALLVFCLWKLGFFARKKIPEEEKREEKLEQ
ncbi:integrin alpha-10 isoform X1 [Prionailurus iriomotensis]